MLQLHGSGLFTWLSKRVRQASGRAAFSSPINRFDTTGPVKAPRMDGALQYGPDGRRPRPYGRGRWRFDSSMGQPSGPSPDGRL